MRVVAMSLLAAFIGSAIQCSHASGLMERAEEQAIEAKAQVSESQPRKRPNIVMIVSDDQAYTDYSFMGHPHLKTPHLDRLAAQSLTFRRGYVPSSLCCPSLATILTGRFPHQHKITGNDPPLVPGMKAGDFYQSEAFQLGRKRMNEHMAQVPTLPRLLQEQGYVTLQTGKFWQGHYSNGGFTHGMTRGERHGDDGLSIGRKTMKPIEDFLDMATQQQKPWMVWYAPLLPHDPHTPPEKYLERTKPLTNSEHIAKYWGMVEWFDDTVGQLMESLEKRGLAEDTIVVYVTDNGWIQNPDKSGYAPKSKQSPYEGGVRTPIMIRWPRRVSPEFSSEFAHSIDLVPTLLTALEIPLPEGLPGVNLLDAQAVGNRKIVFGECFTHNANDLDDPKANLRWRWAIRDRWKLIVPNPEIERQSELELYDLESDPTESNNLAKLQEGIASELLAELDAWWK
jgi:arylsulfatase A-like enzyme